MKTDRPDSGPSRSSILGLDALNFLMADVRDGVGPYLSIYLKGGLHWQSGLGAGVSNVFAGFVVQVFGYTTGFLALAAVAAGGLFFFASFMPETKPEDSGDEVPSPQAAHSAGTGS
jgi:hypothetical protein